MSETKKFHAFALGCLGGDYAKVRDVIAQAFPEVFHDFNARLETPGGFRRPIAANQHQWKTKNKKANFLGYESLVARCACFRRTLAQHD